MGEQIQRELTEVLRRGVKDSRIGNVTITAVDLSGDLRTAKVFYLISAMRARIRRYSADWKVRPESSQGRGCASAAS